MDLRNLTNKMKRQLLKEDLCAGSDFSRPALVWVRLSRT